MSCEIYYYLPQGVDVHNLVGINSAVTDLRMREKTRFVWIFFYHGLRGSASPLLTATRFDNGRGQFSTPTESTPLDRSPKNLLLVITSATPTAVPNLVQIFPRGASGQMGEI